MSDDFFAVAAKDDAIAALRDRLTALERELAEARDALRRVDTWLTEDLGGWYVGAPEGEPLGDIRTELRRWL